MSYRAILTMADWQEVVHDLSNSTVTLSLRSTTPDEVIIPSRVTRCTWRSPGLGLHTCSPATPVRHNCNGGGLAALTFSSCVTRHGCDDCKYVNETAGRVFTEVPWTADYCILYPHRAEIPMTTTLQLHYCWQAVQSPPTETYFTYCPG